MFRDEVRIHAQQVGYDQNLPVAANAGADSNSRNGNLTGNLCRQVCIDAFQNDGKRAGVGDRVSVFEQSFFRLLNGELAQVENLLRPQTDMRHNRDSRLDQSADQRSVLPGGFHLDGVAAGYFNNPRRLSHAVFNAGVTKRKRHVGNHKRTGLRVAFLLGDSRNNFRMINHFVQSYAQRRPLALNDVPEGIADKNRVDARCAAPKGLSVIVSGEHGKRLAAFLLFQK